MKKLFLLSVLLLLFPAMSFAYPVYLYDFTGDDASVYLEITGDGTSAIIFDVQVLDPEYADLRGVWFNFDPFPFNSGALQVTGDDVTSWAFIEDGVTNLGGGNNLNPEGPFDAGVEIGLAGIGGEDDFYSTSFTVSSTVAEALHLGDFFGARLTSVGTSLDYREGSSKLVGSTAPVPEPATMLLLGTGLIGLAGASRKKIFKK